VNEPTDKNGEKKARHSCWWPDLNDNPAASIVNREDPDFSKWKKLPGRMLGIFDSIEAAERALKKREGSELTEDGSGSGITLSETDTISEKKTSYVDPISIVSECFGDTSSTENDDGASGMIMKMNIFLI